MSEKKLYELTPSQDIIFFNLKYSIKPAVINVCTTLHFDEEINPELMLKAIEIGLDRNIASKIRIVVGKDKKPMQYFTDEKPQGLEILDYSKKSQKAYDKIIAKMSKTPFPNKSREVQLYNAKLIKKPDGKYGLYFCINHIAFDAYSLMYMASDIIDIYVALRDGTELPKNKYRTLEVMEQAIATKYNKEKRESELNFWSNEVYGTEPKFTSVNGLGSKEYKEGVRYGETVHFFTPKAKHLNKTLPKVTVDKINEFAKSVNLTPKCVYLLAVRNYLAKMNGNEEDVAIMDNLARRATLAQKNSGGTYADGLVLRWNFSNDMTFKDACKKVSELQLRYYAHTSCISTMDIINCYETKYKKPPMCGYAYFSMTFQPFAMRRNESVPTHLTVHSNGYNALPIYMTIMALDDSGDLNFNYDYNVSFLKEETIEKMHDYILKFFDAAIANPDKTLRELQNL